jgi:integrase
VASIKKLANGKWRARWRDPARKSQSKTFPRYVEAEQHLTEVEHGKLHGAYIDPNAGKVKFATFADQWLTAQTFDASTRAAVQSRLTNHILPTFGDFELRQARPSTVQAWLKGRSDVAAPRTVSAMLTTLNAIFGAAVEDGLLAKNPCQSRSVSRPTPDREKVNPWTVEQLHAVIDAHPAEWRAIPIVGAGTGLRQGEIFGLQIDDVDFLRRRLLVRHQVKQVGSDLVVAPPKGRRSREVPLPDVVAVALSEHLRSGPRDRANQNPVFHRGGDLVEARGFYNVQIWKPALRAAGLEPSRRNGMHILRHTYASMQLEAGTSVRALAEYLGHHDPGFTLRTYTHLMPASEDRARQAIDQALGTTGDDAAVR